MPRALDLLSLLLATEVVVIECVAGEVMSGTRAGEIENMRLEGFLKSSRIVSFNELSYAAGRLSSSDLQTLTCALSALSGGVQGMK